MIKKLYLLSDKIKYLREGKEMTQSDLARYLGLSRSSVNSWEMGISTPSTQYVVELAKLFNVSSDYLLGIDETATVSVSGLSEKEVAAVIEIINCFKKNEI